MIDMRRYANLRSEDAIVIPGECTGLTEDGHDVVLISRFRNATLERMDVVLGRASDEMGAGIREAEAIWERAAPFERNALHRLYKKAPHLYVCA